MAGYPLEHFDDVNLIVVFADLLERALAAYGITDCPVVQLQQPTQQPRGESGAFFSFLFDDRVGWTSSSFAFDKDADDFLFTESQHLVGSIQVSVLYPFNPEKDSDATRRTAKDIANYLAMKMNSMNYIKFLRAAGLGILRIKNIKPNPFENDRGQYEFMPSFEMELTYNRQIGQRVPKIVELIGVVERI